MAYLNGIFIKKATGKYGPYLSVGIKKDEFIKNLKELSANENGYVNVAIAPQKNDRDKYSVKIMENLDSGSKKSFKGNKKEETDDLPF